MVASFSGPWPGFLHSCGTKSRQGTGNVQFSNSAIFQSAILQSAILQSVILQSVFIQSASYGFVFDIRVSVGLFLETVHVMLLFRVNKTVASHALFTFRLVGETSVLYNSKIDTLSYSLETECWSGLFPFVQPSICWQFPEHQLLSVTVNQKSPSYIWIASSYSKYCIVRLTHVNVWEPMGRPCSCRQLIQAISFTASHTRTFTTVLRVTQKLVSGTVSHTHCIWTYNENKGLYDKNITKLYRKRIPLICFRWHCYLYCSLITITRWQQTHDIAFVV